MDDVRPTSPADTKLDRGRVGGSLGKGLGALLPGVTVCFLSNDAFGHNDKIVPLSTAILVDCDIFFTRGAQDLQFRLHSCTD